MSAILVALGILLAGCRGEEGETGPRAQGSARLGGDVVATVDGVGITLEDLQRVTASTGVAPPEALRLLEEKELLAAHAEQREFGGGSAVRLVERRVAVQRVLVEIERASDEEITEEEIQAVWSSSFSGDVPEINDGERVRVRDAVLLQRRLRSASVLLRDLEEEVGVERDRHAIERLLRADLGATEAP